MNCRTESSSHSPLDVFVMEVDMSRVGESECRACDTTMIRVQETVEQLRPVFSAVGVEVRVDKLLVRSEAEARALGLRASPMIRIGAIELAPEHRDTTDNGPDDKVQTTRLWEWDGQFYRDPPVAMLLDALLRAYATAQPELAARKRATLPAYVRQYLSPEQARASTAVDAGGSSCS